MFRLINFAEIDDWLFFAGIFFPCFDRGNTNRLFKTSLKKGILDNIMQQLARRSTDGLLFLSFLSIQFLATSSS
jgi:hypothetical protein